MDRPDSDTPRLRLVTSGASETSQDDGLSGQLGRLALRWDAADDTPALLGAIVTAALELVPGAEAGSMSIVSGRVRVSFQHPSGTLPARVDAVQEEVGEGPCLDAVHGAPAVRVPDLSEEQRWPRFTPRAAELGARSMLSLRLAAGDGATLGALNLVNRRPYAFVEESERVGLHLTALAAIAYAHARKVDNFREAVAGRDRIGQAKGMLMERCSLDADQAFAVLVRASQHRHRKLRDVADELVTSRSIEGLDL